MTIFEGDDPIEQAVSLLEPYYRLPGMLRAMIWQTMDRAEDGRRLYAPFSSSEWKLGLELPEAPIADWDLVPHVILVPHPLRPTERALLYVELYDLAVPLLDSLDREHGVYHELCRGRALFLWLEPERGQPLHRVYEASRYALLSKAAAREYGEAVVDRARLRDPALAQTEMMGEFIEIVLRVPMEILH